MDCTCCSGLLAHSVLVRSVKDLHLCPSCAQRLAFQERQAMIPLVVASFAQFLHDRNQTLVTEPCRDQAARRFWEELAAFGDVVETIGVVVALEELARHAPSARIE
jgi:hypothetical protein